MQILLEELYIKINNQEVLIAGDFYTSIEMDDDNDVVIPGLIFTDKRQCHQVCPEDHYFIYDAVEDYLTANTHQGQNYALQLHELELDAA